MNSETGSDIAVQSGDAFADQSGQYLRILEALLFASDEPVARDTLIEKLPEESDVDDLLSQLAERYANRGVNLVQVGRGWAFRTAPDLAPHLTVYRTVKRRLSRAALETLSIIAYHQPITRAEVEEVRGVSLSRGTLDQLLEAGWVKPKGRRRAPGRPLTWVTTDEFLGHFGLQSLSDLPGVEELKAAGLLQSNPVALGSVQELPLAAPLDENAEYGDIELLAEEGMPNEDPQERS
ncbi:MAG: SMC-Scp complex subunit ScpB [Rhodospirillaceae bacterium]|nr:SMC-Scp complex subunit ScpB [Rhodospirillaceae bacterium]|tara:strand:+ start:897 stop:1604 length:708 start_codon:yes stop_codon:yes gene_type:complete